MLKGILFDFNLRRILKHTTNGDGPCNFEFRSSAMRTTPELATLCEILHHANERIFIVRTELCSSSLHGMSSVRDSTTCVYDLALAATVTLLEGRIKLKDLFP
ncbi:hypothetical protein TNCV_4988571 [Trichonephila clavipes]|nr:hypothetical protein TNCV_4988571 [Trichonephila clavipes]